MATGDKQYAYLIFTDEGEVYGTDDGETAEHASTDEDHIVIETKTGMQLATGVHIHEYPQYEEEDPEEPEDI